MYLDAGHLLFPWSKLDEMAGVQLYVPASLREVDELILRTNWISPGYPQHAQGVAMLDLFIYPIREGSRTIVLADTHQITLTFTPTDARVFDDFDLAANCLGADVTHLLLLFWRGEYTQEETLEADVGFEVGRTLL